MEHQDLVRARLAAPLTAGGSGPYAPTCLFHVSHPVNELLGLDAARGALFATIKAAFPHGAERVDACLTGHFADGLWTASFGHVAGLFAAPLFGIRPTGLLQALRFGRFDRWADGLIVEVYLILDLPGLMLATGQWPLAPPMGPGWAPGPATRDGVSLDAGDAGEASASLAQVEAMIAGLMRFDGKSLSSMRMVDFWAPDFCWYGPGPIGSFQGHADYERGHQRPFLQAFPDRVGGDHKCRIGQRAWVASTGWPSIRATHSGGGWLGLPATDKRISMRVMDWWRCEDGLLKENWVFIDIPDLLLQMGVDVFQRAADMRPAREI